MAKINVKYPCNSNVFCHGISGKVTAVFIRGEGRAYEFSYVDNNGNPSSCAVEECELMASQYEPFGYKTK